MGKLGMLAAAGIGAAGGYVAAKRLGGNGASEGTTEHLVHIARVKTGSEGELRGLIESRFPETAVAAAGVSEMTIYLGSGFMLTEYAFDGAFNATFRALREHPEFKSFLDDLSRLVNDEPVPQPDHTATQNLASQAMRWDAADGVRFTSSSKPSPSSATPSA